MQAVADYLSTAVAQNTHQLVLNLHHLNTLVIWVYFSLKRIVENVLRGSHVYPLETQQPAASEQVHGVFKLGDCRNRLGEHKLSVLCSYHPSGPNIIVLCHLFDIRLNRQCVQIEPATYN